MKIPTDLTPLGHEMAFKMPNGEALPMWVRDSDIESWRIAGIKSFDGRGAITSIGTPWFQCALLEGHPIPESALPKKTDRLMTIRERAELIGRFNWGEFLGVDDCFYSYCWYDRNTQDKQCRDAKCLRKWGSDELVRPMLSLLLAARKEAGV